MKGRSKITSIIAVVLLLIGITASFSHSFFTPFKENPASLELNKERSQLKKEWNKKETSHDSVFKNNLISKNDYFLIKNRNEKERKADFIAISKRRKKIGIEFSFNGRNSLHYWLKSFGFSLTFFIVSCFLAFKDAILYRKGLLKWYEPKAAISFIAISLFWLYHSIFMTARDYFNITYLLVLLGVMFPLSYFIYHFIIRVFSIEGKLLENIRNLVSHVLNYTKEEKEDEKWELLEKVADNGK